MIGPRSTFAISSTSVRFPMFVKCLGSWSTRYTPSAILNTKNTVTCSYCSYRTLGNCIFSNSVVSVQNRIPPLQGWNCAIAGTSVASNAIISWKKSFYYGTVNGELKFIQNRSKIRFWGKRTTIHHRQDNSTFIYHWFIYIVSDILL